MFHHPSFSSFHSSSNEILHEGIPLDHTLQIVPYVCLIKICSTIIQNDKNHRNTMEPQVSYQKVLGDEIWKME